MKTVILAGGLGSRLSELTESIPKPMVEIGGRPILWHIMNIYAAFGFSEFIFALGYKADVIKSYFSHFYVLNHDFSLDLSSGRLETHKRGMPNWKVHLVDTGIHSQTGGRIRRLKNWIGRETFMLTYGDGVSNVNIEKLVAFHKSHQKLATVTAVRPPARFGGLMLAGNRVVNFAEKNQTQEGWVNGGFFVLEPEVLDYIEDDLTCWEKGPLEKLSAEGELMAYFHDDFWQPMDTLRDQRFLESLWQADKAPWKVWRNDEYILESEKRFDYRSDGISWELAGKGSDSKKSASHYFDSGS